MNDSRDPLAQLVDADRALPEPGAAALDRVWSGIEHGLASGAPTPVLDTKPLLAPSAGWGLGVVSVLLIAVVGASVAVLGARPDPVAASPGLIPPPEWPAAQDASPEPEPEVVEQRPVSEPAVAAPAPPPPSSRTKPRRSSKPDPVRPEPDSKEKPEPKPEPELGFADELALMRTVSQALARGDTARASTLLRQHERQFPKGALLEERNAAAVRIACARDHAGAGAKRAAFEKRWPKSMHAAAIRSACGG